MTGLRKKIEPVGAQIVGQPTQTTLAPLEFKHPSKHTKMPKQSTESKSNAKSRGAGGRPQGKAAARAEEKNAEGISEFVGLVESASASGVWPAHLKTDPLALPGQSKGFILARVIRNQGGGRVDVRLYSGQSGSARIAERIAFRGNAATKTDRTNCICAGDYVVISDGDAIAKMHPPTAQRVSALYLAANPRVSPPKEFFNDSAEDEQGFVFDRSEEEAEEVDVDAL